VQVLQLYGREGVEIHARSDSEGRRAPQPTQQDHAQFPRRFAARACDGLRGSPTDYEKRSRASARLWLLEESWTRSRESAFQIKSRVRRSYGSRVVRRSTSVLRYPSPSASARSSVF
jgi:hypothetical protein